jgi:hypothetical protein
MHINYKTRRALKQFILPSLRCRRNCLSAQLKVSTVRYPLRSGSRRKWKFCESEFKLLPEFAI